MCSWVLDIKCINNTLNNLTIFNVFLKFLNKWVNDNSKITPAIACPCFVNNSSFFKHSTFWSNSDSSSIQNGNISLNLLRLGFVFGFSFSKSMYHIFNFSLHWKIQIIFYFNRIVIVYYRQYFVFLNQF